MPMRVAHDVRDAQHPPRPARDERDADDERRSCARRRPPAPAMMVVLIAPGPARSGTASGTTPGHLARLELLRFRRASGASRRPARSAWRAPSAAAPGRRRPGTPAGSRRCTSSMPSPKIAAPASTRNTVSVTTLDEAPPRWRRRVPAVTLMKIGMARNGIEHRRQRDEVAQVLLHSPSTATSSACAACAALRSSLHRAERRALAEHLEVGLDLRHRLEDVAGRRRACSPARRAAGARTPRSRRA